MALDYTWYTVIYHIGDLSSKSPVSAPGASKQSQAIEAYLQHARALQLPNHIVASFTSWVGSTRCGLELW
jgi:hypothetical protein